MDLIHIFKDNFQTNFCDTEKDFNYYLFEKHVYIFPQSEYKGEHRISGIQRLLSFNTNISYQLFNYM